MPIITVTLIEGYDASLRSTLASRLSDAARAVTGAASDGISVVIHEVPAENYMRGGKHRQPGTPPATACDVVRSYLSAMEDRDLAAAREHLAEGFSMTFPGNQHFQTPEQLVEWAKQRYQSVGKTYQRFDEAPDATGTAVYCYGTLQGKWLDGSSFSGIRFIDRFLVHDGKLLDQQVWNDLAENMLNVDS